tara:strand:+ start:101502 stop:102056 length:555 start_codon:yes stop_codon:yes gene_type:complete
MERNMSYSLSHIQHTAHYIVNRCQYTSGESLGSAAKRELHDTIVLSLSELASRNTQNMIINPANLAIQSLFDYLAENYILFPQNVTFKMTASGRSFESMRGQSSLKIYDCTEVKHDHSGGAARKYRAIRDEAKPSPLGELGSRNEDLCQPAILTRFERSKQQKTASKNRAADREYKYDSMRMSP